MSSGGLSDSSTGGGGGDWICSDVTCHHLNFARRTKCNKCNRARSVDRNHTKSSSGSTKKKLGTEIGKAAAEKSRGLFSAEDWQCSKCANVNWARRQTCNMCNAPRFCDVEERTGYGGGYNDRGVVEYKEREESDSEYDEFGRLKKRKNKTDQTKDGNDNKESCKNHEEDEDDEEDDGDDEDLAKYDLFGDEAEFADDEKKKEDHDDKLENMNTNRINRTKRRRSTARSQTRSRTRSRSRSRSRSDSYSRSSSTSSSTSSTSSSSRSRSRSRSPSIIREKRSKVYTRQKSRKC